MCLVVLAFSATAPLAAFGSAPALVLAFWRNAIGLVVITAVALLTDRAELFSLFRSGRRRELLLCFAAGSCLALHFAAFMPSAQLTSVATATALVSTQPVWQGLIAVGQGRRLPALTWIGTGIAVLGSAAAAGADLRVEGTALIGDLLAVVGAIGMAGYAALGERARTGIGTTTYATICFATCTFWLLVVCLAGGLPLVGFDTPTWLAVAGLVLLPQLLGQTSMSFVLGRVSATTLSVALLLEAPVAAVVALVWLGQVPALVALPGLLLVLVGVAVVVGGEARATRRAAAAGRGPWRIAGRLDDPAWAPLALAEAQTITLRVVPAGADDPTVQNLRPARPWPAAYARSR
jgi:drug/metabolite transporter (DMT)-like permease